MPRDAFDRYRLVAILTTAFLTLVGPPRRARGAETRLEEARWIWCDLEEPAPRNRFTYFRKVVHLNAIPDDATLRFAADSNARIWINGRIVRRKVARYHEEKITAEVIHAGPYLREGDNVVVVLHHNWGDLITFQRTGNLHAGLYLEGDWIRTDETWRWRRAPRFVQHDKQVPGVIGDLRIRYPQILDLRRALEGDLHSPAFDDSSWKVAAVVAEAPWPSRPADVETPGQREHETRPLSVLAAGTATRTEPPGEDPLSIARGMRTSTCRPDATALQRAQGLLRGESLVIEGAAGESHYVTFDFFRPVHGFPFLRLAGATKGLLIDFGYGEISLSQYSGELHVDETGWLNPEGVVGPGYADRVITAAGARRVELPDERTARWLALHVYFPSAGRVAIEDVGIIKSQYPIRPVGSFRCGDERVDQIVKLCLIHAEVTMSDAYIDTPGREDGQWIEDARPRANIAAHWFGDSRLRRLAIRTLAQSQGEDGNLHPFAPSNYPAYPAPFDWSVQWIAFIYDDYLWRGEADTIRRHWDNIVRYWKAVLSHVDADGVWRTNRVLADIRVGVRCTRPRHSSGIVTPWIIERLRWSVEMARAVGEEEAARQWETDARRMAEAFREHHIAAARDGIPAHVADRYNPDDPDAERGHSQAGQTIAVTAGLLDREEARADLDYCFPAPDGSPPPGVTRWNNPTYGYRVLRALCEVGFAERAVAHLIERYSPYLPANARNPVPLRLQGPYGGPLPEYWISREDLELAPGEKNTTQPRDETGSHGWGAVPLLWLHDTLLGVRILEPGGARIRIAPEAAGLPFVAGHTMTPKGAVWVYWDPQRFHLEIALPRGVTADVRWPKELRGNQSRLVAVRSRGDTVALGGRGTTIRTAGTHVFRVR